MAPPFPDPIRGPQHSPAYHSRTCDQTPSTWRVLLGRGCAGSIDRGDSCMGSSIAGDTAACITLHNEAEGTPRYSAVLNDTTFRQLNALTSSSFSPLQGEGRGFDSSAPTDKPAGLRPHAYKQRSFAAGICAPRGRRLFGAITVLLLPGLCSSPAARSNTTMPAPSWTSGAGEPAAQAPICGALEPEVA